MAGFQVTTEDGAAGTYESARRQIPGQRGQSAVAPNRFMDRDHHSNDRTARSDSDRCLIESVASARIARSSSYNQADGWLSTKVDRQFETIGVARQHRFEPRFIA